MIVIPFQFLMPCKGDEHLDRIKRDLDQMLAIMTEAETNGTTPVIAHAPADKTTETAVFRSHTGYRLTWNRTKNFASTRKEAIGQVSLNSRDHASTFTIKYDDMITNGYSNFPVLPKDPVAANAFVRGQIEILAQAARAGCQPSTAYLGNDPRTIALAALLGAIEIASVDPTKRLVIATDQKIAAYGESALGPPRGIILGRLPGDLGQSILAVRQPNDVSDLMRLPSPPPRAAQFETEVSPTGWLRSTFSNANIEAGLPTATGMELLKAHRVLMELTALYKSGNYDGPARPTQSLCRWSRQAYQLLHRRRIRRPQPRTVGRRRTGRPPLGRGARIHDPPLRNAKYR